MTVTSHHDQARKGNQKGVPFLEQVVPDIALLGHPHAALQAEQRLLAPCASNVPPLATVQVDHFVRLGKVGENEAFGGSSESVGVYLVLDEASAPPRIDEGLPDVLMVEAYAPGRELTTTVMGDRALAVTDIVTGLYGAIGILAALAIWSRF